MKIRFTKHFTSPLFGNVYPGKEVELSNSQAEKWLKTGFAEELKEKKDGTDTKRGKDTSKGGSE